MHLVTGHLGEDHIYSKHWAGLNAGIVATADVALVNARAPKITVVDGLTLQLGKFSFLMSGLYVETEGTETITLPAAASGYYKKVWIIAQYDNNSGVEAVSLGYSEGEPARTVEGASAPNWFGNGTSPRDGGILYQTPLFEVMIKSGGVYGDPVVLIEKLYGIRKLTGRMDAAEEETSKLKDVTRTDSKFSLDNVLEVIKNAVFKAAVTITGKLTVNGVSDLADVNAKGKVNVTGLVKTQDNVDSDKRLVARSGSAYSSASVSNTDSSTIVSGVPDWSAAVLSVRDKNDNATCQGRVYSDGRKGLYFNGNFYADKVVQTGTVEFASSRADTKVGQITIAKHEIEIVIPAQKIDIPANHVTISGTNHTIPKQEITIPKQTIKKEIAAANYDCTEKRGVTVSKSITFPKPYTSAPKVVAMAHGENAGARGVTVTEITKTGCKINCCCDINASSIVDWVAVGSVNK